MALAKDVACMHPSALDTRRGQESPLFFLPPFHLVVEPTVVCSTCNKPASVPRQRMVWMWLWTRGALVGLLEGMVVGGVS